MDMLDHVAKTATWEVIPHQKLEYAARESSIGAMTVLFSFMSFHSTSGLVRRLSQSTTYTGQDRRDRSEQPNRLGETHLQLERCVFKKKQF